MVKENPYRKRMKTAAVHLEKESNDSHAESVTSVLYMSGVIKYLGLY